MLDMCYTPQICIGQWADGPDNAPGASLVPLAGRPGTLKQGGPYPAHGPAAPGDCHEVSVIAAC
jgi:hypothetical protein